MAKGLINRERCNPTEERYVRARAVWDSITIESVNGMVGSYSTRLCTVLALMGQWLNGHPDVMRDVCRGGRTPEGIASASEGQAESLQRFVEGSRTLFAALSSGDRPQSYREWIAQSLSLRRRNFNQ
jgi:hypothetical protein